MKTLATVPPRTLSPTLWDGVNATPLARAGVDAPQSIADDTAMTLHAPLPAPRTLRRQRGEGTIWPTAHGRWRAQGRRVIDPATGKPRRKSAPTFNTYGEALVWLKSQDALTLPTARQTVDTLGQVLRKWQALHPKGSEDLAFVFKHCDDLLSVPAIAETREQRLRLQETLTQIGTRRRRTRSALRAKRGARSLRLLRDVRRREDGEWEQEVAPSEWRTIVWHQGGNGREEKRRRADVALSRLRDGQRLTMETLLPAPWRLEESRSCARLLCSLGIIEQRAADDADRVAVATTRALLATMRRALKSHDRILQALVPDELQELGEADDLPTQSRTKEIVAAFGQVGAKPSRRRVFDLIRLACERGRRPEATLGDRAIALMAATGMRNGEVLALRWGRVDVDREVIQVREARTKSGGFKTPKTESGSRDLEISYAPIADLVGDLRGDLVAWRGDAPLDGLLFGWTMGEAKERMGIAMDALCREGGIGRLTPYHLRHCNLLALGARGVHPNDVSLRGGHANAVVTMKVYCLPTALSE